MTDIQQKLKERMKIHGSTTINMRDDLFESFINEMSVEEMNILLIHLRSERNFYKKVLEEKYREKNPSSWRYKDAQEKLEKLNFQGPKLKQLIEIKTNNN